ncbi:MAG: hypothetical protein II007_07735 [Gammaproteobacteria bacterium]|nr:hypothetical protein [Gammaproteobacteria bacterium]
MKFFCVVLTAIAVCLSFAAHAGEGYEIKGRSGVMVFVAVDSSEAENEDVYRFAVADACAGKKICQVHYWIGNAPSGFPLNDIQVNSKVAHWQQNLNTGLRRWLVNCDSSNLFSNGRECM